MKKCQLGHSSPRDDSICTHNICACLVNVRVRLAGDLELSAIGVDGTGIALDLGPLGGDTDGTGRALLGLAAGGDDQRGAFVQVRRVDLQLGVEGASLGRDGGREERESKGSDVHCESPSFGERRMLSLWYS